MKLICYACLRKFDPVKDPGALIFGPPEPDVLDWDETPKFCKKDHLCRHCYIWITNLIFNSKEKRLKRKNEKNNRNSDGGFV